MTESTPTTLVPPAFENDINVERPSNSKSGIVRLDKEILIPDHIKGLISSVLNSENSTINFKPLLKRCHNNNNNPTITARTVLAGDPITIKNQFEVSFNGQYTYNRNESGSGHQVSWLAHTDGIVTDIKKQFLLTPNKRAAVQTAQIEIFDPKIIVNAGFIETHTHYGNIHNYRPILRVFTDSKDYENVYRTFIGR